MPGSQKQSGGDDSINLQAGNDMTVYQGLSFEAVRQIALDVFDANFLRLTNDAADLASSRAEQITRDFLDEMQRRAPAALTNVGDPDMLRSIYKAQEEYACSGEEDLEKVLVDLVVDRAGQSTRDLKTLALNEAIATVARLTADQRSAIAICFLVRHTSFSSWTLDQYYKYLRSWIPFISNLPVRDSAYAHIQYTGAASLSRFELELEQAFAQGARRFFTHAFRAEQIFAPLNQYVADRALFMPCLREPTSLQATCSTDLEIEAIKPYLDRLVPGEPLIQLYRNLTVQGRMTPAEIRSDVVGHIPELAQLFDTWNNSSLGGMSLTSVGMAIGHAYWRRLDDHVPDLSIWL
jgi:hypothetical protein